MIKTYDLNKIEKEEIFSREEEKIDVSSLVKEIIDNVKEKKDEALKFYAKKFDGVVLDNLKVTEEEFIEAENLVEKEFIEVLKKAKENITAFHKKQLREGFKVEKDGVITGQRIIPIKKVGLYVPGGTAGYPSTVLMDAIPAIIAGCKEIVVTSPPKKDGKVNPYVLTAVRILGLDNVYKVGGAQAIGALAYGTETVKAVDKIVGPGNVFVAEAKRQVFGKVNIDMIAGPSEILIVADKTANPKFLASDMLSQAEHDKNASAVLITDDLSIAKSVEEELERQIPKLERSEIARASIDKNGKIIIAKDIKGCIDLANEIAPEHLELCVNNAMDYLENIENAGSVFIGHYCPEAMGDYYAGTNHTLPTSGTARFSSPLSVDDFIKKTQFISYTKDALKDVYKDVVLFANKEGLTAHAKSASIRFEED